jgi:hypothetical protein
MIVMHEPPHCIDLHNEIIALRPEWYSKDDDKAP